MSGNELTLIDSTSDVCVKFCLADTLMISLMMLIVRSYQASWNSTL